MTEYKEQGTGGREERCPVTLPNDESVGRGLLVFFDNLAHTFFVGLNFDVGE